MTASEGKPVVWNVVGNNFTHKKGGHNGRCATHGKLPRHVAWSFDGEGEATFYLDDNIRRGVDDGIDGVKFGWLLESRSIRPGITEHLKKHYERYFETYRAIFTHNQELLALDERFKFTVTCGFWVADVGIHPKTKRVSAVNSGKTLCEGHLWRNAFIERHRHELDLFGNRYRHIARKELALNDYMFSVAIENARYATYFTEKLLDCFATGTIPIYYGAPDIGDFFNADGIVLIDDRLRFADLTEDFYHSRMDAIRDNFERVRAMETAEDWMYRRYRDELFRLDDAKTRHGSFVVGKYRSSANTEVRAVQRSARRSSAGESAPVQGWSRKVFGIGMFKTGTTTFGRAMEILGFRSEWRFWRLVPELPPYFDLDTEKFRPFHDEIRRRADEFDCLADAPWLYLYRELAEWYPDSVFVLTLRQDARLLAESDLAMWRRIGLMERWRREVGPEPTREMFVRRYERHNAAVVRYFEDKPDRLLAVCWETHPDPWSAVCDFLGVPAPRRPFPHENRRSVNVRAG